jgi:hypothetical protein
MFGLKSIDRAREANLEFAIQAKSASKSGFIVELTTKSILYEYV